MFQLATQLKKRSMLWMPFGASSGRWPFTRTTNTEPRKVGPAWHTLHGWGKRMAGTEAMPLPPKSRTKFHNSVLFGKQVISVFIKPVLAQPASGRLVIWWVSQGCGLHGVTTKLTSVKRGRTRKSSLCKVAQRPSRATLFVRVWTFHQNSPRATRTKSHSCTKGDSKFLIFRL